MIIKKISFVLVVSLCFVGAGCSPEKKLESTTSIPPTSVERSAPSPEVKSVANGLERMTFQFGSSAGEHLLLYKIDPAQYDFSIEHASSARSIADWQLTLGMPMLVVNGAYFHEDYSPSGMLIINGERIGSRTFDLDKSALLELSPLPQIIETKTEVLPAQTKHALQSYPLLVRNGMNVIQSDSGLVARRTFFGFDTDGFAYIGILADAELSLFELGHVLEKNNIKWKNVLNLDGGPSSGLAVVNGEIKNSIFPVPNVIVVKEKVSKTP